MQWGTARRDAQTGSGQAFARHQKGRTAPKTGAGPDQRQLAESGLEWERWYRSDAHDATAAESAARELMSLTEPPTAIFTTNNRITAGALRALRLLPVQPALVGFDDFDLADVLGVTVIAHDVEEMGGQAARLALGRLGGDDHPPRAVVMPTVLISRGSGERPPV